MAGMTKPSALLWYVVMTQPQREHTASKFLRGLGFETLFLRYHARTCHARKIQIVTRPYFPRYIFVGLGGPEWLHSVNSAFGVATAVYCGDRPLQVPQGVIDELSGRGDDRGFVWDPALQEGAKRQRLANGQAVRVDRGFPFEGFRGLVELDSGAEIRVWLQELSHRMRVTFPPEALSPVLAEPS